MNAIPKTEVLTPTKFQITFRNQLLIPHPQLLAHATCACGQDVDVFFGVHTHQKRRLDDNLTNSTLNRFVACLAKTIRSCGQSVRMEVTGTFNNVDPTSNQRMYLVDYDPGRSNQLYDAVATNPATAAVLRFNITNLWVAWTQRRTK